MPRFATPGPINAHVEAGAGSVRLVAADRDDTVVEVRPHSETRSGDSRAAEEARIYYADGKLTVAAGKWGFLGARTGAVDITIELPSRSRVRIEVASADVQADGEYAECRFASASGDMHIATVVGDVKAATSSGALSVHAAEGDVSMSTASGKATIGTLDGDLKFQAASGALALDRLRGNLRAQTASGSVSIATALSGSVVARTSSGDIEVGVAEGTAARLDVTTGSGLVSNQLQHADGPADGDETLLVQVRTGSGDVGVRRASGPAAA
jgi:DUF4097 and DUF4098 domain-containing protein YvlB